jgi:hypothetical protein
MLTVDIPTAKTRISQHKSFTAHPDLPKGHEYTDFESRVSIDRDFRDKD